MAKYTLHYFPFSSWSLMTRYAIALRGEPYSHEVAMIIEEKFIHLHHNDNLSEEYLLKVNPKGQVPSMTSCALPVPLTDSKEIIDLLCERYPNLLPQSYKNIIDDLLAELRAISIFSLSHSPSPPAERAKGTLNPRIDELLAQADISDAYRKALEFKSKFYASTTLHAVDEENVKHAEEQAKAFLQRISKQRSIYSKGGLWIFSDETGATALDAHTVVFIARLIDADRTTLIPTELVKYAEKVMAMREWQTMTQGRPTLFSTMLKDAKWHPWLKKFRDAEKPELFLSAS